MPGIMRRLRDWRDLGLILPIAEDPAIAGGRQAERFLETLVQSHLNFQGAILYPNKRVPAGRRRREIDLIVVTAKRIHVIEVKNWSGSLRVVGDKWVQTNRNNREIAHANLAADHQDKNAVLIDYLLHEGVALGPDAQFKFITNKIIFMNPRLSIEDPSIREHPNVLPPDRLNDYLDRQRRASFGERMLGSVIQWCLDSESAGAVMEGRFGSLASDKVEAVRAAFDKLSTWDAVHYYGSRVETGDLLRLTIGGTTYFRDRLGAHRELPVRWTRHRGWGFIKALTGLGKLGRIKIEGVGALPLSPRDSLLFHKAGEPTPVEIPLGRVKAIDLG